MSLCMATPSIPMRVSSSLSSNGTARPRPHSASSIPNAFHHTLLSAAQRSRATATPHAFHDAMLQADTAPKSIRMFKGHAKDILRHLFFALLVRFFVFAIVAVGVVGTAAWYVWVHSADERLSFRPSSSLDPPAF